MRGQDKRTVTISRLVNSIDRNDKYIVRTGSVVSALIADQSQKG